MNSTRKISWKRVTGHKKKIPRPFELSNKYTLQRLGYRGQFCSHFDAVSRARSEKAQPGNWPIKTRNN